MGYYVDVADVKAEGVPSEVSNATIIRRITKWEAIVERITRNIFRQIEPGELTFDGNNSRMLHFSLPLIEVTSLKINGDTVALDADDYRAYTSRGPFQDDRWNPKIELTPIRNNIWRSHPGMFVKGLEQRITAKWGFLEADDTCPQPVKDAIVKLVVLDIDNYFDASAGGGGGSAVTPMKRERTDGHEVEYMQMEDIKTMWSMLPNDVAEILSMYRAPWKIAAPEPIRFIVDPGVDTWVIGF